MIVIDGRKEENLHYRWSPSLRPVASVRSGDEVRVIVPDSSTLQIRPDSTTEDLGRLDESRVDAAVGPILVEGAEPGDALMVENRGHRGLQLGMVGYTQLHGAAKGQVQG
jgi:Predicted acetamidase/formamidase